MPTSQKKKTATATKTARTIHKVEYKLTTAWNSTTVQLPATPQARGESSRFLKGVLATLPLENVIHLCTLSLELFHG